MGFALAVLGLQDQSPWNHGFSFVQLIGYIVLAASYVSIINDFTDREEDAKAGKRNALVGWSSQKLTLLFVVLFGVLGYAFYSLISQPLALVFYVLTLLVYSAYSFPPIRLKNRGIWGLWADACGANLFIALFAVAYLFNDSNRAGWICYLEIGFITFIFGIRGIIWHQFHDKKNDEKAGVQTAAVMLKEAPVRRATSLLFILELIGVLVLLCQLNTMTLWIGTIYYGSLLAYRHYFLKQEMVIAISQQEDYHLIGSDWYEWVVPFCLLFGASLQDPDNLLLLMLFLFLFPRKGLQLTRETADVFIRWYNYLITPKHMR